MYDYSLEMAAKKIYDPRSRDFFSEVLSSYNNRNYRSTVVGLWSVVVCDLLFKLEYLKSAYGDPNQ